jgi:hypothetical protein
LRSSRARRYAQAGGRPPDVARPQAPTGARQDNSGDTAIREGGHGPGRVPYRRHPSAGHGRRHTMMRGGGMTQMKTAQERLEKLTWEGAARRYPDGRPIRSQRRYGMSSSHGDAVCRVSKLDQPFRWPAGRGDPARQTGGPDPPERRGLRREPRDIYVPDLRIETLKLKARDFR